MQHYLIDEKPSGVVTEDYLLCHICRDTAHIQADTSRWKPERFEFDAAFIVNKPGSRNIWVGNVNTTVTNDDVAAANRRKQELQDYIDDASSDHSSEESAMFQRQAAQLNFLSDCTVYLFVGGVEVMKEAVNTM